VTDDSYVTPNLSGPDLRGELLAAGKTFTGYAEGLKRAGFTGDKSGAYRKKHDPWVDFTDVPAVDNQPLTAFPGDFSHLPTLSFVIPTDANNMHSGSPTGADSWLRRKLGAYAAWAQAHNSLLIVTWDEDDGTSGNQIPTIFYGPVVRPGQYNERITHYSVLRTLEDMYGLGHAGASASATAITDVWGAG
jgi:acid phosphatase